MIGKKQFNTGLQIIAPSSVIKWLQTDQSMLQCGVSMVSRVRIGVSVNRVRFRVNDVNL